MAFRKKSYKKGGTKRRTYKRKGYKRATKATKKVMRKVAKAEIHKLAEDKFIHTYFVNYSIQTGVAATLDASILPITPGANSNLAISVGAGRTSRVGNKISTRSMQVKGTYIPAPQSATQLNQPCPILMDVYCFYDKTNPNGITQSGTAPGPSPPTPAQNGDFFYEQNNNTGVAGFTYSIADHNRMVNEARYKIFWKKTYKIGWQYYDKAGVVPANEDFANNDFKSMIEFDYHCFKDTPKTYSYTTGTTIYPREHGLWLLFVPMRLDGGVAQAGEQDVLMTYDIRYKYEDC